MEVTFYIAFSLNNSSSPGAVASVTNAQKGEAGQGLAAPLSTISYYPPELCCLQIASISIL